MSKSDTPRADIAENEWCPTQNGKFIAYEPEWRYASKPDSEWEPVPRRKEFDRPDLGAPAPLSFGGICDTICLCGYAQANALAWLFAAKMEARGESVDVRAEAYEVIYEIKARKLSVEKSQ